MTVVGGLRARFLHDSVMQAIEAGLDALGWFDPGRAHRPIQFFAEPQEWNSEITANSMVVTSRSRTTEWMEVGSLLTRDTVVMGVDIYGESDSLVVHLANDVRDLLRGRLAEGPQGGSLPILDLRMTTPTPVGFLSIGTVRATRVRPQVNRPYSLFWMGVDIEVLDTYYDSGTTGTYPSLITYPAAALYPGS